MNEQEVIEQLSNYKRMQARLQVLSNYSVGAGITVSRLNEDDHLQELHSKLRGLPSYMYLSEHEQLLERIAGIYTDMEWFPVGVKSQQKAIPANGVDDEDTKLLKELKRKISKVVAARGYDIRDDLDTVLHRITELQDVQHDLKRIDDTLAAVARVNPQYAKLLRLRHVNELSIARAAEALGVSESTFKRWHPKAVKEFIKMTVK